MLVYKGDVKLNDNLEATLSGWCVVEGGINRYVYSVDGGVTWLDADSSKAYNASQAIINVAQGMLSAEFGDATASKKNGSFQEGVKIDLSAYEWQTVNIIFAAVSESAQNELVPLFILENVLCVPDSIFNPDSIYKESEIKFGAHLDYVNGIRVAKLASSSTGMVSIPTTFTPNSANCLELIGWCAADGGVSKYVWTADNGATWHEFIGSPRTAENVIVETGQSFAGVSFSNFEASKINGSFQTGNSLTIDLSAYAGQSETVSIIIAALPKGEIGAVCPLYLLTVAVGTESN